jgi:hypothetical protein
MMNEFFAQASLQLPNLPAKKLKPSREIPGVLGRVSSNCNFYLLGVEKIQISPAIFTPFTPFNEFTRIKI